MHTEAYNFLERFLKKENTQSIILPESDWLSLGFAKGLRMVSRENIKPPDFLLSIQMFPISNNNLSRASASRRQSINTCSTVSLASPQEQALDQKPKTQ